MCYLFEYVPLSKTETSRHELILNDYIYLFCSLTVLLSANVSSTVIIKQHDGAFSFFKNVC